MSKAKPARPDSRRAQLRATQIAEAKRAKNRRIAIIAICVLVAAMLVTTITLVAIKFKPDPNKTFPPNANAQRNAIRVFPEKAQQGAPVVTLFADYQCPACASFEKTFGQQLEALARNGDIQLEYHLMTFLDTNLRNDASNRSANAAACADLAGRYAQYHNTIYSNQPADEGRGYSDAQLTTDFPQKAGITGEELNTFKKCYSDKRYNAFVKDADTSAGQLGVTSTPALRVNGKTLDTKNLSQDPNSLRAEIMKLK